MATFITTMHFTEQGIKAVRETCERAAGFKATAQKMGVKVTGLYWTLGAFDGVIVDGTDESLENLLTASDQLLRAGARTRIEVEKLLAREPERGRGSALETDPAAGDRPKLMG